MTAHSAWTRDCDYCGVAFTSTGLAPQRFCSQDCSDRYKAKREGRAFVSDLQSDMNGFRI